MEGALGDGRSFCLEAKMQDIREFELNSGIKGRSTTIHGYANELEVAAGTTGLAGGDGSLSFFGMKETLCRGTTVVKVEDEALEFSVEIGGDSEVQAMIKALKFIVETLEAGIASKE